MFLARLKYLFRAQEAANVIGAKRRLRAFHRILRDRQISYVELEPSVLAKPLLRETNRACGTINNGPHLIVRHGPFVF